MNKLFTVAIASVAIATFSSPASAGCTKTWPNGVEYIHPCDQMPASSGYRSQRTENSGAAIVGLAVGAAVLGLVIAGSSSHQHSYRETPRRQQRWVAPQIRNYGGNSYRQQQKFGWHNGAYYPRQAQQTARDVWNVDGRNFYRTCTGNQEVVAGVGAGCFFQ